MFLEVRTFLRNQRNRLRLRLANVEREATLNNTSTFAGQKLFKSLLSPSFLIPLVKFALVSFGDWGY